MLRLRSLKSHERGVLIRKLHVVIFTVTHDNQGVKMIKKITGILFGFFVAATVSTGFGPQANALPGQCGGGGAFGFGGGFCDGPPWPDGSFYHCESLVLFGIGGSNCFQACPIPGGRVPTDSDPATPC